MNELTYITTYWAAFAAKNILLIPCEKNTVAKGCAEWWAGQPRSQRAGRKAEGAGNWAGSRDASITK